jgi:NAD(P)-dependent dehydrogenase (short-subunit alcohol dehydrogenase family)
MKRILVTGANKGIGLAIVEAILREQADCSVLLGARDLHRGGAAREALLGVNGEWSERLSVLELDVASDQSVAAAASQVAALDARGPFPLYALVNNAGVASAGVAEVLDVNVYGIHRVCEALVPLICPGGRIVNITSAAGPNFVAKCDVERQRFFLDPDTNWHQLDQFMRDCRNLTPGDFAARGLGSDSGYGLSKACANTYTMCLARQHSELLVNACTPGFIQTDLGMAFLSGTGRTPAEAGMKSPAAGARAAMFLLFGEPEGTGHYYGSDCLRSPLDHYRAPGSPAYRGT